MASTSQLPPYLIPALKPPPGLSPDFEHPPTLRRRIIAASVIFPAIAACFVAIRIYTRAFITRALWWDDYSSLLGLVFSVTLSAVLIALTNNGLGVHQWDVRLTTFSPNFLMGLFHASWLSVITPTMLRMSLCLLYLRIFGAKPWMRALSYTGLALDWINALIFLALIVWRCSPRAKIWDITVQGGSCVNLFNLSIAGTVMTFGLDFLVFILPIPAVWQLHLPRPEKMAVLAIFMTGSVAIAVNVARLVTYVTQSYQDPDVTWSTVPSWLFVIIEADIGIICACAPVGRPFLRRFFPNLVESGKGSSEQPGDPQPAKRSWPHPPSGKHHSAHATDQYLELGEGGSSHVMVQSAGSRSCRDQKMPPAGEEGHIRETKTIALDIN